MDRLFDKAVATNLKKRDVSEINRDEESETRKSENSNNDVKRILPKLLPNNARVYPIED